LIWHEQILEAIFDPAVQLHPWYRKHVMAHQGLTQPKAQSSGDNEASGGLSQNSITLGSLARIPDLVHAPQTNRSKIQDLYRRACLDVEELVQRRTVMPEQLAHGECFSPVADIAVEMIIPLRQTAHSVLLSVVLGYSAILSALSPWDASLAEDSSRYCENVLSLAKDMAPYRPLGASHFPLCLIAAYVTAADALKQKQLREWLTDFQKDFPCSYWLALAMKARASYWTARRLRFDGDARGGSGKAGQSHEEKDGNLCAVQ
jgi:hypothetical protein